MKRRTSRCFNRRTTILSANKFIFSMFILALVFCLAGVYYGSQTLDSLRFSYLYAAFHIKSLCFILALSLPTLYVLLSSLSGFFSLLNPLCIFCVSFFATIAINSLPKDTTLYTQIIPLYACFSIYNILICLYSAVSISFAVGFLKLKNATLNLFIFYIFAAIMIVLCLLFLIFKLL